MFHTASRLSLEGVVILNAACCKFSRDFDWDESQMDFVEGLDLNVSLGAKMKPRESHPLF